MDTDSTIVDAAISMWLSSTVTIARYRGPDHIKPSKAFTRQVDAERFLHDRETRKIPLHAEHE